MGRVDEAMRRAAESRLRGAGDPAVADLAVGVPKDSDAIGPAELFPLESQERPRFRTVSPAGDATVRPVPALDAVRPNPSTAGLQARMDAALAQKVVIDQATDPVSREQYRKLGATLHAAQADSGIKVIMVASALPNEGKTLTASNLAMTFSESYQRSVLLIDADLRKPSLHSVFGLEPSPGLTEGLGLGESKLPLHRLSQNLTVLTAGIASSDPIAVLTSDRMRRLIEEAREKFDWIIIDTPPVGLLSDASLLTSAADGVLLVVRAGSTPYEFVDRAAAALGRDRVLGIVLNGAEFGSRKSYSHYHYYGRHTGAKAGA